MWLGQWHKWQTEELGPTFPWSETFSAPALTISSVQSGQAEKHQHSRYFSTGFCAGPELPAESVLVEKTPSAGTQSRAHPLTWQRGSSPAWQQQLLPHVLMWLGSPAAPARQGCQELYQLKPALLDNSLSAGRGLFSLGCNKSNYNNDSPIPHRRSFS